MILCVGTTPTVQRTMEFDRLELDEVNRAARVHEYASGKSLNVARVLGVLGEPAVAVGFAGGRRGDFLLEEMTRAGIANDFVSTAAQTRLCTTIIDRQSGRVTELVEESQAASAGEWEQLIERINTHAARTKVIVFSGSVAGGAPMDWPVSWLEGAGAVVVDASGRPMRHALAARGRVIAKLNRREFEATIEESLENEERLRQAMLRNQPRDGWLIVTMGKAGALACADGRLYRVTLPKLDVISPIGSGDAFAAGLAAAVSRSEPVENALQLACACGVANALTLHSGLVHRADVERLVAMVRVESI